MGSQAAANPQIEAILREERRRWRRLAPEVLIIVAVVLVASWASGLLDLKRLREGVPDLMSLVGEMFPPDFTRIGAWIGPVLSTLGMSITGTALAVLFSVPLGVLAARTTAPNRVVYGCARTLLNLLRAVPELIMGIVFVAAVGFGALPGVLAIGFHSIGMVGKFFAESIENADPAAVEAVRATGASPLQVIFHGILPQVWPYWRDVMIYRWEYNFRASTVLGAVGAGGIGLELIAALRVLEYRQVLAIILVILVMVTLVDGLGRLLQRRYK